MSRAPSQMATAGLTIRLRLQRLVAAWLARLNDRIEQHQHPPADRERELRRRLTSTYAPWPLILDRLASKALTRTLFDSGALGNDLPRVTTAAPAAERVLVLAAHQDDETLGAGGTLILLKRQGAALHAVYTTDGATAFASLAPEETAAVRRREAKQVWQRLAGTTPDFLDLPNRSPALDPAAATRLSVIIASFRPTTILLPNFLEQPIEHRRVNDLLIFADQLTPLPAETMIWGYQVTTRVPGTLAVDITPVRRAKARLNRLWRSQNAYLDYAYLATGRDIANGYFLRGTRQARRHAETFLAWPARLYLDLARAFADLPETNAATTAGAAPDFFVVGLQKSGSYWVTALLDAHPEIRCFPSRPGHSDGTGEAHLFDGLALLGTDYVAFRKAMKSKLGGTFRDLLPAQAPLHEARKAMEAAIAARFADYCRAERRRCGKRLIGEKTTETVHHPALLARHFPDAKTVCILRDPRDRVVSFHHHEIRKGRRAAGPITRADVEAYIARVQRDYAGLLALTNACHVFTYEALSAEPEETARRLLAFLGAAADPDTVQQVVGAADFTRLSGRRRGDADGASHFRAGLAGGWRGDLDPALAAEMIAALEAGTRDVEARFGLDLSSYRT